jgi:hypothetical protein
MLCFVEEDTEATQKTLSFREGRYKRRRSTSSVELQLLSFLGVIIDDRCILHK